METDKIDEIENVTSEEPIDLSKRSILKDVKELLDIPVDMLGFDNIIKIHINSVFMILDQIGVGTIGYRINDDTNIWSDYLNNRSDLEAVKTYIYLKVKLVFDPPQSSTVIDAIKQNISELEWRINSNV